MLIAFSKGLLFGFGLMFAMGPVFFTIVQTSLQRGFKSAIFVATGVMLSDAMYVTLILFGLSQLVEGDDFRLFLAITGGIIMISYGAVLFFRKIEARAFNRPGWEGSGLKYLVKGWLMNFLNPFVFIFWLGVAGLAEIDYESAHIEKIAFFAGIILIVYSSDIVKSYLANRLRAVVTITFQSKLNRILGIILVICGVWLLSYAYSMGQQFII